MVKTLTVGTYNRDTTNPKSAMRLGTYTLTGITDEGTGDLTPNIGFAVS